MSIVSLLVLSPSEDYSNKEKKREKNNKKTKNKKRKKERKKGKKREREKKRAITANAGNSLPERACADLVNFFSFRFCCV